MHNLLLNERFCRFWCEYFLNEGISAGQEHSYRITAIGGHFQ